jgi:diguanylate cyclase (GGDEF)-like protein
MRVHSRLHFHIQEKYRKLYNYLFAAVLMVLAVLARLAMAPVNEGFQYVTFFPAVALAAIAGGFTTGLFATLIGIALATYFFIPPYHAYSLEGWQNSFWSNIVFLFDGIIVSFAIETMHRYRRNYQMELKEAKESEKHVMALNQELGANVVELKNMEDQVRQLAFYDTLTNLPNRRLLNDRLIHMMAVSKRSGSYNALMFLDLDNFKPLNDTHGHAAGDLLLIEAASRLKSCVREMDTVARFGGDEFVVMISELSLDKTESIKLARNVAEAILKCMAAPYLLTIQHEGKTDTHLEHQCTVSIGVVVFVNHEESQDDLLRYADAAMSQAKGEGRNLIRFYDETAVEAGETTMSS